MRRCVDGVDREGVAVQMDARPSRERLRKRPFFVKKNGSDIVRFLTEGSTQRSAARKYGQRYLEVLSAAARAFAKRGYQSATTKDIADEIGLQQGSLYYYIKSKESALEQICDVAIDGYVSFSDRIRRGKQRPSEKLRTIIELHLSTLDERPDFFKVFQENRNDLGDKARHKIGRQIRVYEKNIEAIFRQGIRASEFRNDIDAVHATLTLLAACNSVSVWWKVRSSATITKIAADISAVLLRGVIVLARE
jgi:TetR/AcrR family transcriptional regulator, cholesterol catabolism regulator